jgi:thiol-disulfide isomerase/thioredoxin
MKKITLLSVMLALSSLSFAQMKELSQKQFLEKVVNTFESPDPVYKGEKPCVVLFYSNSCPYSKQMEKHIVEAAKRFKNNIFLYKVDVFKIDEYLGEALMSNIDFKGTPTVAIFSLGDHFSDIFEYFSGMATVDELEEVFNDLFF